MFTEIGLVFHVTIIIRGEVCSSVRKVSANRPEGLEREDRGFLGLAFILRQSPKSVQKEMIPSQLSLLVAQKKQKSLFHQSVKS